MSLATIAVAFALVAAVFNAAGVITALWGPSSGVRAKDGAAPGSLGAQLRAVWLGATFEALVLTLLAALWFGSLGHGGWVILFLLLGALPAGDRWLRRRLAGASAGGEAGRFAASLLKYLLAGLVCAWRLT